MFWLFFSLFVAALSIYGVYSYSTNHNEKKEEHEHKHKRDGEEESSEFLKSIPAPKVHREHSRMHHHSERPHRSIGTLNLPDNKPVEMEPRMSKMNRVVQVESVGKRETRSNMKR